MVTAVNVAECSIRLLLNLPTEALDSWWTLDIIRQKFFLIILDFFYCVLLY